MNLVILMMKNYASMINYSYQECDTKIFVMLRKNFCIVLHNLYGYNKFLVPLTTPITHFFPSTTHMLLEKVGDIGEF